MTNKFRFSLIATIVMAASLLAPITSASADTKINACVSKKTGAMRVLTSGKCKSTEKKLTWTNSDPSATNATSLWFSPRDLVGQSGANFKSKLTNLQIATNDYPEVLDLAEGEGATYFRAIPKGWAKAKSVTFNIYWISTAAGVKFSPEIYTGYAKQGTVLQDDFINCTAACPIPAVTSAGPKAVNVITYTRVHDGGFQPADNSLLSFSIFRNAVSGGNVYLLGISVSPNTP